MSNRKLPALGYRYIPRLGYRTGLRLQQELVAKRIRERESVDTLLLLQHPPTYTNGRRFLGKTTEGERERLEALGAEYIGTKRGGQITFHGPGQLVGYPIVHLQDNRIGVRCYVDLMEKALIDACATFGVPATTSPDTGVWVGSDKIAAIGIQVQRHVTSHGFALNCNTDLGWFDHIVPCGLVGKGVTTLTQELLKRGEGPVLVEDALPIVAQHFARHLGRDVEELSRVAPEQDAWISELIERLPREEGEEPQG